MSDIRGKPDIVFTKARVVVFCDGDFWNGRYWRRRKLHLSKGHNAEYWVAKIEGNRQRDRRVNRDLRHGGWFVLRLWETDIARDPEGSAKLVKKTVDRARESR